MPVGVTMPSRFGPAAAAVAGIGFLSVMDGLIKHAALVHSVPQIAAMRYFVGALVAFALFRALRTPWPDGATVRPHLWRAVVVSLTALSFFYALSTLPLAVTLALSFTSPIFIALFAALILKERAGRQVLAAIALGFLGVLVVLWAQLDSAAGAGPGDETLLGIAAALFSAVTYALSMVALKSRAARDPLPTIVLLQNALPGLMVTPLAASSFAMPTGGEVLLFLLIGTLGVFGHICMAFAYGRADASRLGVFEYTAFVWAVGIGLVAFGEIPSLGTLGGAALIVAGALIVSRTTRPVAPEPDVDIGP